MAQNPTFQQQKVIIPNKYGYKLVGILHESGSKEIVILCHGGRASKENFIMTNLAAALENAGISSFRFDFTGNGESEGSFEFGGYWREADDIHAVAQHFHKANRTVIAIVGHSKGANVALLFASKYHDIKTIVNLSGCHDLKVGLENRSGKDFMDRLRKEGFIELKAESGINYRVTEESLKDRLNIIMLEECLHIDKECSRIRKRMMVFGQGPFPRSKVMSFGALVESKMEPSMATIYNGYGYAQYKTFPLLDSSSPTMQPSYGYQQYPRYSCSYYQHPALHYGVDFESTRNRLLGMFSTVETFHPSSPPFAPLVCIIPKNDLGIDENGITISLDIQVNRQKILTLIDSNLSALSNQSETRMIQVVAVADVRSEKVALFSFTDSKFDSDQALCCMTQTDSEMNISPIVIPNASQPYLAPSLS
ncbi:hypothetical protein E2542_SST18886 [Spatholobus suberectus]|nr:hypothetical protein E2542_SST18886 [Spatholobus suberectus]